MDIKPHKVIGFIFVILLHSPLIISFISHPLIIPPKETYNQNIVEIKLIPPPSETAPIEDIKDSLFVPEPKYEIDTEICNGKDNTYLGAGFLYFPGLNVVTSAPPFYPAYKAGLREGDMVANPDANIIDGYMDIVVERNEKILSFHIKVDHICFQKS